MSEKKGLEYYLSQSYPFNLETLSEEDGGGYLISYPDLQGCFSDGDTAEESIRMGEDARRAWIQARYEDGLEIPEPFSSYARYSGRITLRAPKTLHRKLIEQAEKEGVSLNQYLVYLLSRELVVKT
ncbi:MAG: toxin-antitoxin system HicB family antitoxin [Dethiobacteria bacterium]|jgi:antitoxin HicB